MNHSSQKSFLTVVDIELTEPSPSKMDGVWLERDRCSVNYPNKIVKELKEDSPDASREKGKNRLSFSRLRA
jgi:hypothetical protein